MQYQTVFEHFTRIKNKRARYFPAPSYATHYNIASAIMKVLRDLKILFFSEVYVNFSIILLILSSLSTKIPGAEAPGR